MGIGVHLFSDTRTRRVSTTPPTSSPSPVLLFVDFTAGETLVEDPARRGRHRVVR
jgi:hypothetical protein